MPPLQAHEAKVILAITYMKFLNLSHER